MSEFGPKEFAGLAVWLVLFGLLFAVGLLAGILWAGVAVAAIIAAIGLWAVAIVTEKAK